MGRRTTWRAALLGAGVVASCGSRTGLLVPAPPPAPRLIAPLSTSSVTSHRPTLRWTLEDPSDGARVELCRDPSCSDVVQALDVAPGETSVRPDALSPGVWFWRVRTEVRGVATLLATPVWEFRVGARDAAVDTSWGTMLDLDLDGYADAVATDPYTARTPGEGAVYFGGPSFFASASGADARLVGGTVDSAVWGLGIASAGDVDGDGDAEVVIVGAPGGTDTTTLDVFAGGPRAPTYAVDGVRVEGAGRELDGWRLVGSVGDFDGDGYGDVYVSCVRGVFVLLGGATGLDGGRRVALRLTDPTTPVRYVVAGGDLNGDGRGDVVVATASDDPSAPLRIAVYAGAPGVLDAAPWVVRDVSLHGGFGYAPIAGGGDIDGDGFADLVVARSDGGGRVQVRVLFGGARGLERDEAMVSEGLGAYVVPVWAASPGDLDGDGFADVVLGSPVAAEPSVMVDRGSAEGLAAGPRVDAPPGPEVLVFGHEVERVGDLDGDGRDDAAVYMTTRHGMRLAVYPGAPGGMAATPGRVLAYR